MPEYVIRMSKKAEKALDKLNDSIANPIIIAINSLGDNPRPFGCKKLKDRVGYRIRVGNYRIIYDIFEKELVIDVIDLGHRKDVYD